MMQRGHTTRHTMRRAGHRVEWQTCTGVSSGVITCPSSAPSLQLDRRLNSVKSITGFKSAELGFSDYSRD